jgi:hypothetical protein
MKKVDQQVQGKQLAKRYDKYTRSRKEREDAAFKAELTASKSSTPASLKGVGERQGHSRQQYKLLHSKSIAQRSISLKHAKRLAKYAPLIQSAAKRHNVPIELICGVILQESGGNARARSHCGAKGLMQLMPATARRFGVKNSYDPAQNIEGGVKYLRYLIDRFDGDLELVCAGYNAGEGNVSKYGNKIPPFRETRNYVPAVLGYTRAMTAILEATRPAVASASLPDYARRA